MDPLTRDELHDRINKANFDPATVEVVGFMDTRAPSINADGLFGLPADEVDRIIAEYAGYRGEWIARNVELFGREYPGSKCEHCGANIRWAGIVKYLPTGQHFIVGETCAEERMSLGSKTAHYARLERMAVEHRAEMERRANARAVFFREHPAEAEYLFNTDRPYDQFLDDLARKLDQYGDLTEKQLACITRNITRDAERAARIADRDAQMADVPALVPGRREITGTVVSTKEQMTDFGMQVKMVVEQADGNRIYGTIPQRIFDTLETDHVNRNPYGNYVGVSHEDVRGLRVTLTATVTVSENDEHFGFYKRPANASVEIATTTEV
jgi:hypothetical protein